VTLAAAQICLTAGDGGFGVDYAKGRVKGIEDAYASMTKPSGEWSVEDRSLNGRTLSFATQAGAPELSLIFLWLPDGDFPGDGFDRNDHQSLHKLVRGQICSVNSVHTLEEFSLKDLRGIVRTLIDEFRPTELRIPHVSLTTPDHSDHRSTVAIVRSVL
jgi:hypothetical protein